MKNYFAALLTILSATAFAQRDTASATRAFTHSPFERHSTQVSLSLGFIDAYRTAPAMPAGFEHNNTSGYANVSVKVDHAIARNVSLAAAFGYNAFVYNYNQLYQGNNNTTIRRYMVNRVKIFNLGIIGYYHLGGIIKVARLDPFVGVGLTLNNIRYSAYPQGDSTLTRTDHTVTPYLKAGVRYYLSDRFSIFADAGYEKQAIIGLGFSCRFLPKNSMKK